MAKYDNLRSMGWTEVMIEDAITSIAKTRAENYMSNWSAHKIEGHVYPTLQLRVITLANALNEGLIAQKQAEQAARVGYTCALVNETPNIDGGVMFIICLYFDEQFAFAEMDTLIADEALFFENMKR